MPATALAIVALVVAFVGTAVIRRYAMARLLDVPNDRSSHSVPTPRGGGVAICAAHLLALVGGWTLGVVPAALALALGLGGTAVALVGFADDHRPLPASTRLVVHFGAATWLVACFGAMPPVDFGSGPVDLGVAGTVLAVVYVVWFLNLFNFMDGIDGIAGLQAIAMTTCATVALCSTVPALGATSPTLSLAAAALGFLLWNWPPARIFMGDAGSGYTGYALGAVGLWTVTSGWLTVWFWLIAGGVFLADATVTLAVRAATGAHLADAHRSHAYQRLARHVGRHLPVTLGFGAVNLFWIAPWAAAAHAWPTHGAAFAIVALVPLALGAFLLGAGRPGELGDAWSRWK